MLLGLVYMWEKTASALEHDFEYAKKCNAAAQGALAGLLLQECCKRIIDESDGANPTCLSDSWRRFNSACEMFRSHPLLPDTVVQQYQSRNAALTSKCWSILRGETDPGRRDVLRHEARAIYHTVSEYLLSFNESRLNGATIDDLSDTPDVWMANVVRIFWLVIVLWLVAMASWSLAFSSITHHVINRLKHILDNVCRFGADRALLPQLGGTDEIARLDSAFHDMAAALSESWRNQRALIDNSQSVICSLDHQGRCLSVSKASQAMLGYLPEELVGTCLTDIVVAGQQKHTGEELLELLTCGDQQSLETRVVRKDGCVIDIALSAAWSESEGAVFCVARDITVRKRAEQLRQEIMQMVSHDLRGPLGSIQAFHEMLADGLFGPVSEAVQRLVNSARAEVWRILQLINTLLDAERVKSGMLELDITDVNLPELLKEAAAKVEHAAQRRDVAIVVDCTVQTLRGDRRTLLKVVEALACAAIDVSADAGTVHLSAGERADGICIAITSGKTAMRSTTVDGQDSAELAASQTVVRALCSTVIAAHGGTITEHREQSASQVIEVMVPQSSSVGNQPEDTAAPTSMSARRGRNRARLPSATATDQPHASQPSANQISRKWRFSLAYQTLVLYLLFAFLNLLMLAGFFFMYQKLLHATVESSWLRKSSICSMQIVRYGCGAISRLRNAASANDNSDLIATRRDLQALLSFSHLVDSVVRLPPAQKASRDLMAESAEKLCVSVDNRVGAAADKNQQQLSVFGSQTSHDLAQFQTNLSAFASALQLQMPMEGKPWGSFAGVLAGVYLVWLFLLRMVEKRFLQNKVNKLEVLVDNVDRFEMGRELNPLLAGSDELAKIDEAMHDMANALHNAKKIQRALIENVRAVICSIDRRLCFVFLSPACQTVLGRTPGQLTNSEFASIVLPDFQKESVAQLTACAGGRQPVSFESRVVKPDGSIVDVLVLAIWSETDNRIFCTMHDITQDKTAQRERQEVVHVVTDDIRKPLALIEHLHQILKDGTQVKLSEKGAKLLRSSMAAVATMLRLIDDLRDMERLESGSIELHKSRFRLSDVFQQSVQAIEMQANVRGVEIVVEPTDLSAVADADRLSQVLVNLLSNAIKFTGQGKRVFLSSRTVGSDTEILVSDQGRGIPPHLLEHIFDRFKQVEAEDASKYGGTGLGLAICKALMELHGGDIRVESTVGVGTTFTCRFPQDSSMVASAPALPP